jgi:hypothetical protein
MVETLTLCITKMRKNIVVFFTLVLCVGCNNELDLLFEQPPLPVVYCYFNPSDSNYYVSLTKSVSADCNAYELISHPENVFFDSAMITLTAWGRDSALWSTGFVMCDIEKTKGIFPQTSGYLYESKSSIAEVPELIEYVLENPVKKYTLEVFIPELNSSLLSTIPTIEKLTIRQPRYSNYKVSFTPEPMYILLHTKDKNKIYKELWMRFRYEDVTNEQEIQREVNIVLDRYLYANDGIFIEVEVGIERLLNKLKEFVPPIPDSVRFRRVKGFDISVMSADDNYKTYTETYDNLFEGSGLIWSNFDGNGIGLFAHYISVNRNNFFFSQPTVDSIALNPITDVLGFVKWQ